MNSNTDIKRALIVDDEAGTRDLLVSFLGMIGFETHSAADGAV